MKTGFQLNVLDILAQNEPLLSTYQTSYNDWKQICRCLDDVLAQVERDKADEDYVRFQLQQLNEAALRADEQDELEQESSVLSHAEEIKAALYRTEQMLTSDEGGLLSTLKDCQGVLNGLERVYPPASELASRIESTYIELKDVAQEVTDREEETEFSPERLDEVNNRLNLIYSLEQKHHVDTVEALLALAEDYSARLAAITSSDDRIVELQAKRDAYHTKIMELAAELTKCR